MDMQQLVAALQLGAPTDVPGYIPVGKILQNWSAGAPDQLITLAGSVNSVPFEPSVLGSRGIFDYQGEMTRTIAIEFDGQLINVVPTTPAASPGIETDLQDRNVKQITAVRIARKVTVLATEIDGYRALASTGLDTVENQADRKLKNAVRDIRATLEYHRVGAAIGNVLDADGSTSLYNYFTLLGVSQPRYNVKFGTAATAKFIDIAADILNYVEDTLGNLYVGGKPPIVFCGRTFFKNVVSAADVVSAYQYFQGLARLNPNRDDVRYEDFEHGGVIWRQYRGSTTNTGRFIADTEAHLVVDGVPGTYEGYFCPPADIVDKTNSLGVPLYPTVEMLPHGRGYEIQLQSNPIHVNTRPGIAVKLYDSSGDAAGFQ